MRGLVTVWLMISGALLTVQLPCGAEEVTPQPEPLAYWGRVVDDLDDQPIAGAAVLLTWHIANPPPNGSPKGTAAAVTSEAGRFEFPEAAVPTPRTSAIMEVVAPGYGVQSVYPIAGENTVVLKARRLMRYEQCELSLHTWSAENPVLTVDESDAPLFKIGPESHSELAQRVNATRTKMGLVPIDIVTGEPIGSGGVTCPAEKPRNKWGPFTGRVVDKHTGQPIPGAICSVVWYQGSEIFIPMPFHRERFFDARMAVADERGQFDIARLPHSFFAPDPDFSCASPGYEPYEENLLQDTPIAARLAPLTATERKQQQNGWPINLGFIPSDKVEDLERAINKERAALGLGAICFGGIFLCEWTIEDSWFTGRFYPQAYAKLGGPSGLRTHKINNTRVFPVPDSALDEAIERLEQSPVVELSSEDVAHFLPSIANLNADAMLSTAAEGASKDAERWEHEAEQWEQRAATPQSEGERKLLNGHVADYRNAAQIDRQGAQHALSLMGKLKPYLARGVVLNEGSRARFVVYLDGTELWVEHPLLQTDLSHRRPMKRRPVVIFLERMPTKVHVLMDVSQSEWYAAANPAQ